MAIFTANEARINLGDVLLQSQKEPIHITRSGKPFSVVISHERYEAMEELKMRYLKEQLAHAKEDIKNGRVVDGETFFNDLFAGKYD